jgi:hypothetical protein
MSTITNSGDIMRSLIVTIATVAALAAGTGSAVARPAAPDRPVPAATSTPVPTPSAERAAQRATAPMSDDGVAAIVVIAIGAGTLATGAGLGFAAARSAHRPGAVR